MAHGNEQIRLGDTPYYGFADFDAALLSAPVRPVGTTPPLIEVHEQLSLVALFAHNLGASALSQHAQHFPDSTVARTILDTYSAVQLGDNVRELEEELAKTEEPGVSNAVHLGPHSTRLVVLGLKGLINGLNIRQEIKKPAGVLLKHIEPFSQILFRDGSCFNGTLDDEFASVRMRAAARSEQ